MGLSSLVGQAVSAELLVALVSALSILVTGVAGALVVYFKRHFENVAKRSDPEFQRQLEESLLARIDEERAQRKIELAEVKERAEEERVQRKTELAEIKVEHKAELVAERLKFTNEHDKLLQKFASLETRFDTFRVDSDSKYKADTDALKLRVDAAERRVEVAEKRVETLETVIKDLQQTVAGLTAENTTLKREAGRTDGGGEA